MSINHNQSAFGVGYEEKRPWETISRTGGEEQEALIESLIYLLESRISRPQISRRCHLLVYFTTNPRNLSLRRRRLLVGLEIKKQPPPPPPTQSLRGSLTNLKEIGAVVNYNKLMMGGHEEGEGVRFL